MRRVASFASQSPTRWRTECIWSPERNALELSAVWADARGDALKTKIALRHLIDMKELNGRDIDRIIEMAWEDRTPFGAIDFQFGLSEKEVIELMRREMHPKSFKRWRKRVSGRRTKHRKKRPDMHRFKSSRQRSISGNKIT